MGYTTDFSGTVTIDPPLNEDEISFLYDFNKTRRMHRSGGPLFVKGESFTNTVNPDTVHDYNRPDPDQPGLWCQWQPDEYSDEGTAIGWDGVEKFYNATEWMEYIVNKLLSPAARPYIDAHIDEDERLKSFTCDHVVNGTIEAEGEEHGDLWQIVVDDNVVTAEDGRVTYGEPIHVHVWTLTVDTSSVMTQVFGKEQDVYDSLKKNYADDTDFDVTTAGGIDDMITWLTEKQGVVLYIEEHAVTVTP